MKVSNSSAFILKKMYQQNKRSYYSLAGIKKYSVPFFSYAPELKYDKKNNFLYVSSYLMLNNGNEYYINTYYNNTTRSIITKIN